VFIHGIGSNSLYSLCFTKSNIIKNLFLKLPFSKPNQRPVTAAERSEACAVFTHSEAGILGSNPTQGMNVSHVYVFILCLGEPCDEVITRPRSPNVCKMIMKLKDQGPGPKGTVEPVKNKKEIKKK
jgi:hypothetical protein